MFLCPVFASILSWLLILGVLVQCVYAFYFFIRIFSLTKKSEAPVFQPNSRSRVSVVICAKNEAHNLEANLPSILAQRYANAAGKSQYEVIVVNDASTDDTETVLYNLEQQYSQLWHVTIAPEAARDMPGKKFAQTQGVAHATNQVLLFTDADCKPASDQWLATMTAPIIQGGRQIVAGYSGFAPERGLLNAFSRWETIHTFLQYATYALAGQPYMAVGRNMACTKEVYEHARQSNAWGQLPSGDDDLLMATVATRENTAIIIDEQAHTYSNAKDDWSDWAKQKQRHLSTGKYYKPGIKLLLGTYASSHALMWLCFFILLAMGHWQGPLLYIAARSFLYWVLWSQTAAIVKDKLPVSLFAVFDIGWMLYNFVFSPYIFWKNKKQWT